MIIKLYKKRLVYIISTILLSSILINFSKTHAEYNLRDLNPNVKDSMRTKLKEKDLRYPIHFNSDIGDYLVVKIFGNGSPGNGVLIAQKNNFYYIFTAGHVVDGILEGNAVDIQTLDGKNHVGELVRRSTKYDAALIKFKSNDYYYTAYIRPDFVPFKGLKVELIGYSLQSNAVKKISLRKTFGTITGVLDENKDGYVVLYSNASNIGMSGGAVLSYPLDGEGWKSIGRGNPCDAFITPVLVAIHGRAEEYYTGGKSGVNLGLSIHDLLNDFKSVFLRENIENLPGEIKTKIYQDGCPLYRSVYDNYMKKMD